MSKQAALEFSHVSNFTGYMARVVELVRELGDKPLDVLDMPAGNGLLSDAIRGLGHRVISGDFNRERPDYAYVDMEKALAFENAQFDVVICLEGIEHVINPAGLANELSRIVRPGGCVILSLPNVQSIYSRLQFLLTGTFYQFDPEGRAHPRGRPVDRGHVSPLSLTQLQYLFGESGLAIEQVRGDRFKRKILFPVYLPVWLLNNLILGRRLKRSQDDEVRDGYRQLMTRPALFSRSLVTVWRRVPA